MLGKSPNQQEPQSNLFQPFISSIINLKNPLIILGQKINWRSLELEFEPLYSEKGAPSKPIRLMVGLLLLKQMFNKSDEVIVDEWVQNPYYQYFTGEVHFSWKQPCDASELVHFRKRIGEDGVKKIFTASLELHQDKINQADTVITDTTVQEKNITYPTDNKLRLKSITELIKVAKNEGVKLKQTFEKEIKELKVRLRFSHHPRRKKEANKARKRLKTIAGILHKEVSRKLSAQAKKVYQSLLDLLEKAIYQEKNSKDKIYSLHEPQTACIAKGKNHKKYEFGSKISISTLPVSNVIVDVSHFLGNPHDSKTLEHVIPNLKKVMGEDLKFNVVDRGYRGKTKIEGIEIILPNPAQDKFKCVEYQVFKSKKCTQRASIEPIIGHMKSDHRMLRNYLKGVLGDKINVVLAGAAFNFKKALNEIKAKLVFWLYLICERISILINPRKNEWFMMTP